eukprot:5262353-Pyramimonas_sp.AAC.1
MDPLVKPLVVAMRIGSQVDHDDIDDATVRCTTELLAPTDRLMVSASIFERITDVSHKKHQRAL